MMLVTTTGLGVINSVEVLGGPWALYEGGHDGIEIGTPFEGLISLHRYVPGEIYDVRWFYNPTHPLVFVTETRNARMLVIHEDHGAGRATVKDFLYE